VLPRTQELVAALHDPHQAQDFAVDFLNWIRRETAPILTGRSPGAAPVPPTTLLSPGPTISPAPGTNRGGGEEAAACVTAEEGRAQPRVLFSETDFPALGEGPATHNKKEGASVTGGRGTGRGEERTLGGGAGGDGCEGDLAQRRKKKAKRRIRTLLVEETPRDGDISQLPNSTIALPTRSASVGAAVGADEAVTLTPVKTPLKSLARSASEPPRCKAPDHTHAQHP
jgi:hypothetical protein